MKENIKHMKILGIHVYVPLYTIRDPESWGVRLSFLLPPPRTVIGALARGLGILYGIASGEEKLEGKFAREVLCYALEKASFATVRPLSPLFRSFHIMRLVPSIERGTSEDVHDAFKTDFIFCSELKIIYAVNIEIVNSVLEKYGLPKADYEKLGLAARFIDRLGQTESICYVKSIEWLEIEEESLDINTYLPEYWIEEVSGDYTVERLLPNIRILESLEEDIKDLGIDSIKNKDLRKKKIPFVLPLRRARYQHRREILEPIEVKVKPKSGYMAYLLNDKTKIVLPYKEGEASS